MPDAPDTTAQRKTPQITKSCGACTLCCKVMGARALNKPAGTWCKHCKIGTGCGIYETRPEECRTFFCMWLAENSMGEEWRPDRSKLVITLASDEKSLEVRCDPGFPDAWRKEPYQRTIRAWAEAGGGRNARVAVWVGNRATIVAPFGDIPLGPVKEDEEIVAEFSDGRVSSARVVKAGTD
jgi:hypothetical protein